jgi:hypothetical protein
MRSGDFSDQAMRAQQRQFAGQGGRLTTLKCNLFLKTEFLSYFER